MPYLVQEKTSAVMITTKQQELTLDVIKYVSAPTWAQICRQVQTSAVMIIALTRLYPWHRHHAQQLYWSGCPAAQQGTCVMFIQEYIQST